MLRGKSSRCVAPRQYSFWLRCCCCPQLCWRRPRQHGSIVGTVTDPSGAVVSGAKVTITNVATGQTIELTANSAGAFNSGAIAPGTYKVQVFGQGLQPS